MKRIKDRLSHPLLRGLDLDDPRTTDLRRRVIRENDFLFRIYQQWYDALSNELPECTGAVLEIGSGGGFLRDSIPHLITSEVFFCSHVEVIANGQNLPFGQGALRGIVMTNVFHHIPDVHAFLKEAGRCIIHGGVLTMIEPWVTSWSTFVYSRLHHEPFMPDAPSWQLSSHGSPLSMANGALPWIVFQRDSSILKRDFPEWRLDRIQPMMPFRYLVSGGVSMRPLMPSWSWGFWDKLERLLTPVMSTWGMFAHITLRRVP
jgi:SAM-dependent methyltransferase